MEKHAGKLDKATIIPELCQIHLCTSGEPDPFLVALMESVELW